VRKHVRLTGARVGRKLGCLGQVKFQPGCLFLQFGHVQSDAMEAVEQQGRYRMMLRVNHCISRKWLGLCNCVEDDQNYNN
jgi:hypothetical protein